MIWGTQEYGWLSRVGKVASHVSLLVVVWILGELRNGQVLTNRYSGPKVNFLRGQGWVATL